MTSGVICSDPVNRGHPLNRGRLAWWLTLPHLAGGATWHDLMAAPGYHGTLTGMTTSASGWRPSPRPGAIGGHLQFDRVDDSVDLGTIPAIVGAARQSVAAWVLFDSVSVNNQAIFASDQSTGAFGWSLRVDFGNKLSYLYGGTSGQAVVAPTAPVAGRWYRLVGTHDGTTARLYVDGALANSAVGSLFAPTAPVAIGRSPAFGQRLGGAADDVSYWTRALSAAEVAEDYDLSRMGYPGLLRRRPPATWTALYPAPTFRPWFRRPSRYRSCGIY